jgi:IS5 family transposase
MPRLVATDAGFYSASNETAAKARGVKRVCIPNRSTKSPERKREQKKRWFRRRDARGDGRDRLIA